MSSQKGNVSRTRAQKYKNSHVFKNDKHEVSHAVKHMNSIEINNVCAKCKGILEWKIKYKKYKPQKNPSTCVACHEKNVKHAYHTICKDCAKAAKVCPKCGKSETLVAPSAAAYDDSILKTTDMQESLKSLSERRRRAFNRFVQKTLESGAGEDGLSAEEIIKNKLKEMTLESNKSESSLGIDSDFEDEGDSEDDTS